MNIRQHAIIFILALVLSPNSDTRAQEHAVLSTYSCSEFLRDVTEPNDGARLLRSLMMVSWAAGYAAAHQGSHPRADPEAVQLIAAAIGVACRLTPDRRVVDVVIETINEVASSSLGSSPRQTSIKKNDGGVGPGSTFKDCSICPEMVVISAGSFTIGSPDSEKERTSDENQYQVVIAKPFAVGRFAVTFAEWDACVADRGCNGYRPPDEGWGRSRRPVINVSWHDAKAYTEWLSRKTGKVYRLLSDSEREYVTRAGTSTPFWWGASISTQQANYDGNLTYNDSPKGPYLQKTVPVDSFKANPWGLYQVHGNVWEWVEDCWITPREGIPTDGKAWISDNCTQRARRGGSWRNHPQFLRSAVRGPSNPETRNNHFGFRVARSL